MKCARAVIATTPGLAEVLGSDPRRAALYYERWGITETELRTGVREPLPLERMSPSRANS